MHSTPISFHLSRITYVFLGIVGGVFIGTTIKFALGWNAPPAGTIPPANNVEAPINVSDIGQTKIGGLNLGSLMVQGSAKINQRIQIGDISTNDPVVYAECTDSMKGTMRFNDLNDTMEYCDGSMWKLAFGGGSGGGVGNWEDITTDTAYFEPERCLYRVRIGVTADADAHLGYFYPAYVLKTRIWTDFSVGNYLAVKYSNKSKTTTEYGYQGISYNDISTFRKCD